MVNQNNTSNAVLGLTGLVFIAFLTLKLAGIGIVSTWSWWWVTAPLWLVPVGLIMALLIALLIVSIRVLSN